MRPATPHRAPSWKFDACHRASPDRRTSSLLSAPIYPSKTKSMRQARTWLDRRLLAKEPIAISEAGFGHEVQAAMDGRAEHLVAQGLARRQGQRFIIASDLLSTLRQRELASAGAKLAVESGLPHQIVSEGEPVAGVYPPEVEPRIRSLRHDRRRPRFPARAMVAIAGKGNRQAGVRRVAGRRSGLEFWTQAGDLDVMSASDRFCAHSAAGKIIRVAVNVFNAWIRMKT